MGSWEADMARVIEVLSSLEPWLVQLDEALVMNPYIHMI